MLQATYSIALLLLLTSIVAVVVSIYAFLTRPLPAITVRPHMSEDMPVIAIYYHQDGMHISKSLEPRVEFALWIDGRAVWRLNRDPNAVLLTSHIPPTEITNLFNELSRSRLLYPFMTTQYLGADSNYESMQILTSERLVELISWHDLYEQNPSLIGTQSGIASIERGATRKDYTDRWSADYRAFRENWSIIRRFANNVANAGGQPYVGDEPKPTPPMLKNAG